MKKNSRMIRKDLYGSRDSLQAQNDRNECRQPNENVCKAYMSYFVKHPLASPDLIGTGQDIVDQALIMAREVLALTCAEFSGLVEAARIGDRPAWLADRLGVKIEPVCRRGRQVATRTVSQGENIPAAPYLFIAESIFGEKTIRINMPALEELSAELEREGLVDLMPTTFPRGIVSDLEKVAVSHELFHFLFERYESRLVFRAKRGRAAALAEEISACEFSRLLLGLDHLSEILCALTVRKDSCGSGSTRSKIPSTRR